MPYYQPKDVKFNIIRRPVQDIIKPLTPTKAAWKTESSAGPGANVDGIVTVKFSWGGDGKCGLKVPL